MKRIRRFILLGCCLAATLSAPATPALPGSTGDDAVAGDSFGKLRKVHLVRPDLIGYPLLSDFVC